MSPQVMSPELMLAAVRGPQVDDPQTAAAKGLSLANAMQQRAVTQQQLQAGQLELQQKQRAIADDTAGRQMFSQAAQKGTMPTQAEVYQRYGPQVGSSIVKAMTEADQAHENLKKTRGENSTAQLDYEGAVGAMIKAGNYSPEIFEQGMNMLAEHGYADHATQIRQMVAQDPAQLKAITDHAVAASPKQTELATARLAAEARKEGADTGAGALQDKRDLEFLNTAAAATSQQQLDALRAGANQNGVSMKAVSRLPGMWSPTAMADFGRGVMTQEQRVQADQAKLNAENTEKDRKKTQDQRDQQIALEKQKVNLDLKKYTMEFGGDAVKGWASTIAENPDAANSVPPALRTPVMQAFTQSTGLPYPKPLTGTAVDQERAARNTLDKIPRIKELLADPEVASRTGPILGRLGNAEQRIGSAVGLSPQGEAKAQELRTLMRYMVFGEGKAVLGGRMPEGLMQALETSSPNVNMANGTMNGALSAVEQGANEALDNADKQRFGGRMRTRDNRGATGAGSDPRTSYVKGHIYGDLEYLGGDPNSAASWRKASK